MYVRVVPFEVYFINDLEVMALFKEDADSDEAEDIIRKGISIMEVNSVYEPCQILQNSLIFHSGNSRIFVIK